MPDPKDNALQQQGENFYQRLTKIFRSGPAIHRRVKGQDYKIDYSSRVARNGMGWRTGQGMPMGRDNSPFSSIGESGILDRMARYQEFQSMEYCLHGDTKIAVLNGYKTIKELSEEYGLDKSFVVYSYDHNEKRIVPAIGKQARLTRHDHAWKVTFDSGKEIIGTADHRLMLRDGSYVEIANLKIGDAMMPFRRRDLMNKNSKDDVGNGYRWIYNGHRYVREHTMIAEWATGKHVAQDEVVHHKNFVRFDNRPENLAIMKISDHSKYHCEILWSPERRKAMKENNPAERKDITFEAILHWCDTNAFAIHQVSKAFNTNPNVIKHRLRSKGFNTWELFAKTYCPTWQNTSWNNHGSKNPRYCHDITFNEICKHYAPGMSQKILAQKLKVSITPIKNRICENGFKSWKDFANKYENCKVVSVEYYGMIDLYDLTVDNYKNFATDSVVSHNTPEISSALDVVADETVGGDDRGKAFHIYSKNAQIKIALDELFYEVVNVEFNLRPWVRNLVKNGDFFFFHDVVPELGVVNVTPIPVSEVEREEGFDPNDPDAIRFKWITRGNTYLENWQVTHMRILGNDLFLPYGVSMLESSRRIWRTLTMLEDAMLVYRVVRAPDRRVFYIDISNVAPNDVAAYMEAAKATLRATSLTESQHGRQDQRNEPLSLVDDFFIPTRGGETGTKIDTLAGATNSTAIDDVEYMQKKMFAALKVPKPYLNYDENTGAKATLAQEDVRFSRTIGIYQKIILAELNKLAMIHLFAKGFDGEDLTDFELKLSNPSTVALQQRLEIWQSKTDVAAAMKEAELFDENWIQKNILDLTDEDINSINEGRVKDKIRFIELEAMEAKERVDQQLKTLDEFDPSQYQMVGANVEKGAPLPFENLEGALMNKHQNAVNVANGETPDEMILRAKSYDIEGNPYEIDYKDGDAPVKPAAGSIYASKRHNRIRHVGESGRNKTASPDFNAMVSGKSKSLTDLYDDDFLRDPFKESIQKINIGTRPRMSGEFKSAIRRLKESPKFKAREEKLRILAEEIQHAKLVFGERVNLESFDEDDAIFEQILAQVSPVKDDDEGDDADFLDALFID